MPKKTTNQRQKKTGDVTTRQPLRLFVSHTEASITAFHCEFHPQTLSVSAAVSSSDTLRTDDCELKNINGSSEFLRLVPMRTNTLHMFVAEKLLLISETIKKVHFKAAGFFFLKS